MLFFEKRNDRIVALQQTERNKTEKTPCYAVDEIGFIESLLNSKSHFEAFDRIQTIRDRLDEQTNKQEQNI